MPGAAWMLSHSVKVVRAPNMNMKSVKLNRQKKMEDSDEVIMVPVDIVPVRPSTTMIALNTMVMMVRSIAGQMVMSMS